MYAKLPATANSDRVFFDGTSRIFLKFLITNENLHFNPTYFSMKTMDMQMIFYLQGLVGGFSLYGHQKTIRFLICALTKKNSQLKPKKIYN